MTNLNWDPIRMKFLDSIMSAIRMDESEYTSEMLMLLRTVKHSTHILPKGTVLYHGTDRPSKSWNPKQTQIYLPSWFGMTIDVAQAYAKFGRSSEFGAPIIYVYATTKPLKLFDASSEELIQVFDQLYGDYTTEEIAQTVLDLGYDGWYMKDNEVMIGIPALKFQKAIPVKQSKLQEATNEFGGRNMSAKAKIKLMQKYGGKLVTFAQMPQPYQLAIAHYMAVDGEAWEVPHTQKQMTGYNAEEEPKLLVRDLPRLIKQYGNMKFWIAEVPTKMVDAAIRGIYPDYGFANRPTTGRYGEIHPTTNRWPAIVSSEDGEFLQDGNHRFAQYRTRGDETIPLVMYAR